MDETTKAFDAFPAAHAFRHKLRADGRESLAHMLMFPGSKRRKLCLASMVS